MMVIAALSTEWIFNQVSHRGRISAADGQGRLGESSTHRSWKTDGEIPMRVIEKGGELSLAAKAMAKARTFRTVNDGAVERSMGAAVTVQFPQTCRTADSPSAPAGV